MANRATFFLLAAGLALSPTILWAAEHGESHGLDERQIKTIMYQSINVAILIVGLIYFLKKPIREFFQTKRSNFIVAAEKAKRMREEAEQQRMDIQVRLGKLQSTADESIARARAEAADFKNAMLAEAQAASRRIKKEAEEAAAFEIERAKLRLRNEMIKEATSLAVGQMETKLTGDDQHRLQNEFIEHIQVVHT